MTDTPTIENAEMAIYNLLKNDSILIQLCPAASIYYLQSPENAAYPLITYQKISASWRNLTNTGKNNIANAHIQVVAFDGNLANAKAMAKEIRTLLHGYRGMVEDFEILEIRQVNEFDMFETENSVYQCYQSFVVYHVEELN